MINEFVYCPRLFYYEQVLGVFAENEHTIKGSAQHKRVDREPKKSAPTPEQSVVEPVSVTSITLSAENPRVIAKMDLVEFSDQFAVPIDYKKGRPKRGADGAEPWPSDRVQLAIQSIVLKENGYDCEHGVLYYRKTKQRINVPFTPEVLAEASSAIARAWETAGAASIPPPLVDSPKCPGCSLVSICLPDETARLYALEAREPHVQLSFFEPPEEDSEPVRDVPNPRLLVAPRVDRRPLYLNSQGVRVGKSGQILRAKYKDKLIQEVRINDICQVNLLGNVQLTTQSVQQLCRSDIPICYFSQGGWFYGITTGMNTKNVLLRKTQVILSDRRWFGLEIARKLVAGKIRNQRTLLRRNHFDPSDRMIEKMTRLVGHAERAVSVEELLGVEGSAARIYFSNFSGMIKRSESRNSKAKFTLDFTVRNRRPPRDPINALLSYGYALLVKDLTVAAYAVGFDPMVGFYHRPRHGRPALALDLMEPFRPLITDSAVLTAVNTKMITTKDFVSAGKACGLTPKGRRQFLRAYESRMDTLVTHPLFGYRVSYRRLLEIQARLLGKVLQNELGEYSVFVTR